VVQFPFSDSSSDELGFLLVFEASDSSLPGDAMVNGHLLRPGCSAFIVLKTATKKLCFFAREEVGFKLCASAGGGEEDREEVTRTRMYFSFLSRVSL
jgi:hypothetical protein